MSKFEHSGKRKERSPRRDNRRRNSRGNRDSDRGSRSRPRRDIEMTKVTCSSCGNKCEVPFKPTSSKPVYCSDCFTKKDKSSSNRDLDKINKKLDKIMEALEIE